MPIRLGCCLQAVGAALTGPTGLAAIGLMAGALVGREAVWLFAPSRAQ